MTDTTGKAQLEDRIKSLESHLKQENPVLLKVVQSFRALDKIAYRMGLLERKESYATRVSWWPLISVLGLYSSGKSTFINHYLGQRLEATGNQAVDDKFTVISFSHEDTPRVLPGLALDADPRFPFYQISEDIEGVAAGEGRRVDAYLQLKTTNSPRLKGKILIDSPGFDADEQRTSTLRIIDHIVDLSDLVLVFFDARHPEPGAMRDTLEHLVTDTIHRPDSSKFLYILNQIDTAAREDNPEEVFAAWQRALAQRGLTAGRFYRIYNAEAAVPIEDPTRRARFEEKRDEDIAEIHDRMHRVEVERAYRIIGVLEKIAKSIEFEMVPRLTEAKRRWKLEVLWTDSILLGGTVAGLLALSVWAGYWEGFTPNPPPWLTALPESPLLLLTLAVVLLGAMGYVHFVVRRLTARLIGKKLGSDIQHTYTRESLAKAFAKNTGPWHSIFTNKPLGWGQFVRRRIARVLSDADGYVQALNDQFTNPSGTTRLATPTVPLPLEADEERPTPKPSQSAQSPAADTPPEVSEQRENEEPSESEERPERMAPPENQEQSTEREAAVR